MTFDCLGNVSYLILNLTVLRIGHPGGAGEADGLVHRGAAGTGPAQGPAHQPGLRRGRGGKLRAHPAGAGFAAGQRDAARAGPACHHPGGDAEWRGLKIIWSPCCARWGCTT